MPAEVFSRIEAALAAEPAPVPLAPVVNLNAASRGKQSRGPMIFKVAASVVGLVGAVALGLAVVQNGGGSSGRRIDRRLRRRWDQVRRGRHERCGPRRCLRLRRRAAALLGGLRR